MAPITESMTNTYKTSLHRCGKVDIKLNGDKMDTSVSSLTFMGHWISASGVHSDPDKIGAIIKMKAPKDLAEL